jgi:hypothetical protein
VPLDLWQTQFATLVHVDQGANGDVLLLHPCAPYREFEPNVCETDTDPGSAFTFAAA